MDQYAWEGRPLTTQPAAVGVSARNTADWSSCSLTDSGTAVVLRDEARAASTWSMSHSSFSSQLRRLRALALAF